MAHTLFDQWFDVVNHNWQTLHQYTGSHICWHFDFFGVWHFCLGTCWHFVSMTWRHSSWGTFLHSNRFAVRQTGGLGSRSNVLHFSFGTCNDATYIYLWEYEYTLYRLYYNLKLKKFQNVRLVKCSFIFCFIKRIWFIIDVYKLEENILSFQDIIIALHFKVNPTYDSVMGKYAFILTSNASLYWLLQ